MAGTDVIVNNARNILRNTPKSKLYLYLFVIVAGIGGSLIFFSFMQKETYHTLFSGLSTEDAGMIVTKLKELKVPYKLGLDGTAIHVPKDRAYEIRLMLASNNALPGSGGVGFELFDKSNYGMTEFMQNVNYKRAIQGELSRTINQMPEVKGSRVHIALPEKSLFTDREKEVTASVLLKLKPGKSLNKDQVSGVVHLVAGSIEGLKTEHVTVVDSSGKILYKSGDQNSSAALSAQHFELQKGVERRVEESVQSMLEKFMGPGKSMVRATVELNLRKVEKVEEEYSPEKKAVSAEKKSKEKSVNRSAKAGGTAGVASNVPSTSRNVGKEGADRVNEAEKEDSQISYEVSKSVKKIVEPFGEIRKLSLAIVVDGKYEKVKGDKKEELKYTPRSQKEMSDIKSLVGRAVGFDEERGDRIEVVNMPFEFEGVQEEKELMEKAEKKEMWYTIGQYAFYAVIALIILLFVVKPLINMLKRPGRKLPAQQGGGGQDVYMRNEGSEAIAAKREAALTTAIHDKGLVSSIIKEWVKENQ